MASDFGAPKYCGTYALVLHLASEVLVKVGALGRVDFPRGYYVYAGSARSNLPARLYRHARRQKQVHWHVDRLTVLSTCRVLGAVVLPPEGPTECDIVDLVAGLEGAHVWPRRFGSSDHRCQGHLVHLGDGEAPFDAVVRALEGKGGSWLDRKDIMRRGGSRKRRR